MGILAGESVFLCVWCRKGVRTPLFLVIAYTDDRIVDFYYPILSCFWKIISVSDPNPVLVKIILTVSENYPKVYYDGQHSLHFCVVSILPHEAK